jgi:ABC-type nickel/cobalt efflux system permease component RcnA
MPLPDRGRIVIHDTNFSSSEGTSRLAVRGERVMIESDGPLPADVNAVAIRPVWQLTDEEERQTKQADFRFGGAAAEYAPVDATKNRSGPPAGGSVEPIAVAKAAARGSAPLFPRLTALLDGSHHLPWLAVGALALALGALHSFEPGHGKTLVTAVALGPNVRFYQPAILGAATTIAHTGSVLAIAGILWFTGTGRVAPLHIALARAAGFVIAAVGFWRLGRQLGGDGTDHASHLPATAVSTLGLIGLGLAGGVVPCWDAVALIVLAAALGRLAAGVGLVLAFSAGMGLVLVTLGALAWKAKSFTLGLEPPRAWQNRLGIVSAAIVAAIGLFLFLQ